MNRLGSIAFSVAVLAALPAAACGFHPGSAQGDEAPAAALDGLAPGIERGWLRCPGQADRPLVVWTLEVDDSAAFLGVRDAPLFRSMPANPLVPVTRIGYGADRRFNVFVRAEHRTVAVPSEDGRDELEKPYRVFGTLCGAEEADALDCSVGPRRFKARTDMRDSDGDGVLDLARHEISVYAPGRLQVLRFPGKHEAALRRVVAQWLDALALAGL
ncbi:MAG: hypothetical protein AAF371_11020 [Pseudomonadota bacterium]